MSNRIPNTIFLTVVLLLITNASLFAQPAGPPNQSKNINGNSKNIPQLQIKIFRLNFLDPTETKKIISPFLSPDGTVVHLDSLSSNLLTKPDPQTIPDLINLDSTDDNDIGLPGHTFQNTGLNNILVVRDYPANLNTIAQTITQLDIQPQQVLISLKILSIDITNHDSFGVNMQYLNTDSGFPKIGAASFDDISSIYFFPYWPDTGLTAISKWDNFYIYLEALQRENKLEILATPEILVLNGQTAGIFSGQQTSFQEHLIIDDNLISNTDFITAGTKLLVTPQITSDGLIRLTVSSEISEFTDGSYCMPNKGITNAVTSMQLHDGETIILGGLVSTKNETHVDKIPLLGDIPLIGLLFQHTYTLQTKSELVIVITPHIIKPDSPLIKQKIKNAQSLENKIKKNQQQYYQKDK